ncbi:hypothetical protein L3Q82_012405 [Scortum barcoo]|uniref:Uncharacterized protein n=1 Tax=Scortum barcoo TaxID=214431 RepID=A0ACB8W259_9TELE|nr:hypothetical protein L3Q82_012405 [Scortum barcoo]
MAAALHKTEKDLALGGENGTGDCGKSSSTPGLNIRWPDPEEGPTYCRRTCLNLIHCALTVCGADVTNSANYTLRFCKRSGARKPTYCYYHAE